jgi:hypothetical protein
LSDLSLHERALGADYARLPPAVRRFHRLAGRQVLHGWVETRAPDSLMARVLALCVGSPRAASSGPLQFEVDARPEVEVWTRRFPARTMRSRLQFVGGQIEERIGAARLCFQPVHGQGMLVMKLTRLHVLGLPCPRRLMPRVVAEESGDGVRFHFKVAVSLPLIGVVASYDGHLDVGMEESL